MQELSVDLVLQQLRDEGYGVLAALKEVRRRCRVSLGQAKIALAGHPAWADVRDGLVQSAELGEEITGTPPAWRTEIE